jgi:uncharacterized spore protein YtfJ
MNVTEVVTTVMREIRETARAETVIGTPVRQGDSVLIPVSRVSFGFGAGGGELERLRRRSHMGTGAGARVEPMAFIVVTRGKARLLSLEQREAPLSRLIGMIPDVLALIQRLAMRRDKKAAPREGLEG